MLPHTDGHWYETTQVSRCCRGEVSPPSATRGRSNSLQRSKMLSSQDSISGRAAVGNATGHPIQLFLIMSHLTISDGFGCYNI